MSRYRKVVPGYWRDPKVRLLDLEGKAIGLYILTAQSNRIGCFAFSPALAAEDLGMPLETFRKRFATVLKTLGWSFDEAARVLYIASWWKTNPPENPNNMVGNLKDLDEVPQSPLISEFCANIAHLKGKVLETFRKTLAERYPKPTPTQEQEQEEEAPAAAPPDPPSTAEAFVEAYNRLCTNLPRCVDLTAARRDKIRVRLREHPLAWWCAVFGRANASPFLTGTNDRAWRADFTWLIVNGENAVKVHEGKYDAATRQGPASIYHDVPKREAAR